MLSTAESSIRMPAALTAAGSRIRYARIPEVLPILPVRNAVLFPGATGDDGERAGQGTGGGASGTPDRPQ